MSLIQLSKLPTKAMPDPLTIFGLLSIPTKPLKQSFLTLKILY